MITQLNLNNNEIAKIVLDLQIASYRIEADIIGFSEIPPLRDTLDTLKECDEIFYGCFYADILAGIISYKVKDNTLDIHRAAVHPCFFRRGIAEKLINFVEKHNNYVKKIIVCTGKENIPAVKLYLKMGYKKTEDIEISKGIYLTSFQKKLNKEACIRN